MSKIIHISRYLFIIKKLTATPYSTYNQIEQYVISKTGSLLVNGQQTSFSKRTFQRDLRDIRDAFGVDIEYSKAEKGYFISYKKVDSVNFERMMEAFEVFNSLKTTTQDVEKFIHLENRKKQGTEHLYDIIQAIKKRFQIKFSYQSLWGDVDGEITQRTVAPYALKEFKNRWYVLAKDLKDPKDTRVKSFGLDRLTNLEITDKNFEYPKDYDVQKRFSDYFGIYNPLNIKPQKIVLLFTEKQLEYVKNLPLHHSQKVSDDNELQVELQMCVTFDFVQELLSFGGQVKVLEPQSLIDEIKIAYKDALQQYK